MIRPSTAPTTDSVARHYDELDPFYLALWGEHLHHGYWATGRESPREAALALVDEVARRARIRPGDAVCDVGSGYGAVARLLAERGAEVTGLTVSGAQYRHATRSTRGARASRATCATDSTGASDPAGPRFLLRDWLGNRLPDRSFDAVIAIESLSHMADPGRAVAEAFRVLRPGGRFVACVWLAGASPRPWEVRHLLRPICDEGRLPGLPDAGDYRRWLTRAGFEAVELDDVSPRVAPTWTVSARRLAAAMLRPSSWRYLTDARNTERRFALSVLRLLVGFRTGAMRYGILSARRPRR